jgi:hypothetical protein
MNVDVKKRRSVFANYIVSESLKELILTHPQAP